jgi:siderophore synthetase component
MITDNINLKPVLPGTEILTKEVWQKVNRAYLSKAIAELMHEALAKPEVLFIKDKTYHFKLVTDNKSVYYTFTAELRKLDYYDINRESLVKTVDETPSDSLDATMFFVEMQQTFNIKPFTLTHFIEETNNTLYADAFIESKGRISADVLTEHDYQTIEHQMDGHPWATVNKGRIGFNLDDYNRYVPEADKLTKLRWIAVHRSRAEYNGIPGLDHSVLIKSELGTELKTKFENIIKSRKMNPDDYWMMPVHEWQWNNKIVFQFAAEIAESYIIPLGESEDLYTPQQSIRTFCNTTSPDRFYVKTAISILNTSIFRGLSPQKLRIATVVTKWVRDMLGNDNYLNDLGFTMLGEVATIGVTHPVYQKVAETPYQYKEMLGVIWRESATPHLKNGERLMTMASLLYTDSNGNPFIGALIKKSGLKPEAWLKQYLKVYLKPVLHIFYKYRFFFSPNGENCILVMKDYVPQRIIIKDFVEEIVLTEDAKKNVPPGLNGIMREIEDEYATLFILSGIFDAVFRYISNIMHSKVNFDEQKFWELVKNTIKEYQADHPEFNDSFVRYDLFVKEFSRVCINRVRLLTYGYSESTEIPVPEVAGTLVNPIA